jgi:hypothetical protein
MPTCSKQRGVKQGPGYQEQCLDSGAEQKTDFAKEDGRADLHHQQPQTRKTRHGQQALMFVTPPLGIIYCLLLQFHCVPHLSCNASNTSPPLLKVIEECFLQGYFDQLISLFS